MWTARVTGEYLLSIIWGYENKLDGRAVYLAFLDYYESANNKQVAAICATGRLELLVLTTNFPGGVPAFVAKFRDIIQDLKDAGRENDTWPPKISIPFQD